jgi:hypothetical protein
MEKQPNSRICLVYGIDNPIGLDGAPSACTWRSIRTASPLHRTLPAPAGTSRASETVAHMDYVNALGGSNGTVHPNARHGDAKAELAAL